VDGSKAVQERLSQLSEAQRKVLSEAVARDSIIAEVFKKSLAPSSRYTPKQVHDVAASLPGLPKTITKGEFFAKGGVNTLFTLKENPALIWKSAGPAGLLEAKAMVELEMMGIKTVYAGSRITAGGEFVMLLEKIAGKGSKEIVGGKYGFWRIWNYDVLNNFKDRLMPPEYTELVNDRTIQDLERIQRILEENRVYINDFQFIVQIDGRVVVNDPRTLTYDYIYEPRDKLYVIIDKMKSVRIRN
jgi:hypothetical protein